MSKKIVTKARYKKAILEIEKDLNNIYYRASPNLSNLAEKEIEENATRWAKEFNTSGVRAFVTFAENLGEELGIVASGKVSSVIRKRLAEKVAFAEWMQEDFEKSCEKALKEIDDILANL